MKGWSRVFAVLRRATLWGLLLAVVAVGLLILALQTASGRGFALRQALAVLERATGLRARATALDLHFFGREAVVRGLRLGPPNGEDLLAADEIRVMLSPAIVLGAAKVERVGARRLRLAFVRGRDGAWNLPPGSAGPSSDLPFPLPGELEVRDAEVLVRDEVAGYEVEAGALSLKAQGGPFATTGRLEVGAPVRWRAGERHGEVVIDPVTFQLDDALRLESLSARAPEGTLHAEGAWRDPFGHGALDFHLEGSVDAERVAASNTVGGAVTWLAQVTGNAASPTVRMEATLPGLRTPAGPLTGSLHAELADHRLIAESKHLRIAAGALAGRAELALAPAAPSRFEARFSGVDIEALLEPALGSRANLVPHARVEGELKATWPGLRFGEADLVGSARAQPTPAEPPGEAGENEAPANITGETRVVLQKGEWSVDVSGRDGTLARVAGRLGGRLDLQAPGATTVAGRVEFGVSRIGELVRRIAPWPLAGGMDGSLVVDGTVAAPVAILDLRGTRISAGPLPPGDLRAEARVDRDAATLTSFAWHSGETRATASGSVRLREGAIAGTCEWALPDLSVLAPAFPPAYAPSGSAHGHGALDGSVTDPSVSLVIDAGPLRLAGQEVTTARIEARLAGSTWRLQQMDLRQPDGKITASGSYDLAVQRFEVQLGAQGFAIRALPAGVGAPGGVPLTGRLDLDFAGQGTVADPTGDGRVSVADATWNGQAVGPVAGPLRFSKGGFGFDLGAPDLAVALRGRLSIETPHAFELEVLLQNADLGNLGRVVQIAPETLSGHGTLQVRAEGTLGKPDDVRFTSRVEALDAVVHGQPVRLQQGTKAALTADGFDIEGLDLGLGQGHFHAQGALSVSGTETLRVTYSGDLGELRALAGLAGAEGTAGKVEGEALVSGTPGQPSVTGTARVENGTWPAPRPGWPAAEGIAARARLAQGTLEVEGLEARWSGAHVTGKAEATASFLQAWLPAGYLKALQALPARARIEARAVGRGYDLLAPFLEQVQPQDGGREAVLVARLEADAPRAAAVRGEVTLEAFDARLGDVALAQSGTARLDVASGKAVLHEAVWKGPATEVKLEATATASPPDRSVGASTVAAGLEGRADLRLLQSLARGLETGGSGVFSVRVEGPFDALRSTGRLRLENATMRHRPTRLALDGFTGELRWDAGTVEADDVRGTLNGGPFTLAGTLRKAGEVWEGGVHARLRNGFLEWPAGFRGTLRADLDLEPAGKTMALSGNAVLSDGVYRTKEYFSLQVLELVEHFANAPEQHSAIDEVKLDLSLKSREDVLLEAIDGRMGVGVDLRLSGTIGLPDVGGTLSAATDGQIFMSGRRYEIESAVLDFTRGAGFEPFVQARAHTQVASYGVLADFSGPATRLRTRFSSDPPLGERDIVSLLTSGRTIGETASGGGQTDALSMASGSLLGRGGGLVGLDSVRIERSGKTQDLDFDPTAINSDANPTSRLTFSKRLASSLSATFSQDLASAGSLSWFVAWKPRPPLELRMAQDDERRLSLEFRHDVSFGVAKVKATSRQARRRRGETRVSAVTLSGETGGDVKPLLDLLKLREGKLFTYEGWLRDRDRLAEWFGRHGYAEARVFARRETSARSGEGPRTVALDYAIERGARTRLEVRGGPDPEGLKARIAEAWHRSSYERSIEDEALVLARADLMAHGFPHPTVEARLGVSEDGGEKTLSVTVTPGPEAHFLRLGFQGNEAVDTRRLEALAPNARAVHEAWLDPETLTGAVLALYRSEGRLGARVALGRPVFSREEATLPVVITEGPEFTVGRVDVTGTAGLDESAVRAAAGTAELEAGRPYRPATVTRARAGIEALYRRDGYTTATTRAETRADAASGRVAVTLDVVEGPRQVLKAVAVEGGEGRPREKAEEILGLAPGSPVDLDKWADARQRIYDTGLFRGVDLEPATDTDAGQGPPEEAVTAQVRLESWPALRLRYGLQLLTEGNVASEEGRSNLEPGAVAEVTRRILFGRAVSTGLSVQARKKEQQARAFVSLPRTFGLPLRSSLFVTATHDQDTVDELGGAIESRETEVTFEERARVTRRLDLAGAYNLKWSRVDVANPLPPTSLTGDRIEARLATLTGTALFDARNDLINTTRGSFSSVSLEWGDQAVGSEYPVKRLVGQQFVYLPWARLVTGLAARAELAKGEGTYFVQSSRLEAGGGNTVRGYSQDELASRALINLLGGATSLYVFNAELRFPIRGAIRGVAFGDGAVLVAKLGQSRDQDSIWSTGIGLRYVTPLGILRLDFGIPLDEGFKPKRGRVYFSLGQIF